MDTKKKRSGGFGSIFFMIIIIGIVWAVIAQMSQRTSNYKYKDCLLYTSPSPRDS